MLGMGVVFMWSGVTGRSPRAFFDQMRPAPAAVGERIDKLPAAPADVLPAGAADNPRDRIATTGALGGAWTP